MKIWTSIKSMRRGLTLQAVVLVLSTAASAEAASITLTGNFTADFLEGEASGSFEGRFDDSVVDPANASQAFTGLPLTSLAVTDPTGEAFDAVSSSFDLFYEFGQVTGLVLAGQAPGQSFGVAFAGDPLTAFSASWTTFEHGSLTTYVSGSVTVSQTPVPEPATALLVCTGLGAAAMRRRMRRHV